MKALLKGGADTPDALEVVGLGRSRRSRSTSAFVGYGPYLASGTKRRER